MKMNKTQAHQGEMNTFLKGKKIKNWQARSTSSALPHFVFFSDILDLTHGDLAIKKSAWGLWA